ncbi:hypothetical protein M9H77_04365 [Catharanthus roseus]|uniref:Uncharacterized protein n=1 Tax=Catharanthus roseus TaxID=4058 RepID=A0ACC0CDV8_CATRO|nr:hypothetical protein M9H77_04365 [Catharanthus roseus]
MGRENSDHSAIAGPSIALLQERFKQLQRIKEKREERVQLLDFFADSPPKRFTTNLQQSELILASKQKNFQDSLSLGLNWNSKQYHHIHAAASPDNYRDRIIIRNQPPQWFADTKLGVKTPNNNKFDICDVDTSLHL